MKSCFFIGHRDAGEAVLPLLEREIERHIVEYGVEEFIVGQHGHFDGMAARAVKQLKEKYPDVRLILLLSYLKNEPLPEGFDESLYPEGLELVPRRYAILRANQKAINLCEHVICYVNRGYGGAWQAMIYALKKRKHIVNLGRTNPSFSYADSSP